MEVVAPPGSVLERDSILDLVQGPGHLVEGYLDLDTQLQPNLSMTLATPTGRCPRASFNTRSC